MIRRNVYEEESWSENDKRECPYSLTQGVLYENFIVYFYLYII